MCFHRIMALLYATRLQVARCDLAPATLDEVAKVVGDWAGISDPWEKGDLRGRRSARVRTESLGPDETGACAWRLEFAHPDARDPGFLWTVTVVAIQDAKTELSVRLDRTRISLTMAPPRDDPAPPGCVRAVIDADSIQAVDAGVPLRTNVWVVGEREASAFAQLVVSPERQLPVIGFTPRDDDVFDGGMLLDRVIGLAHVALIQSPATWRLDRLLPLGFNVYGGAVRIWWPGIGPTSTKWDHKLWPGDVSARRIADEIAESVVEAMVAAARSDGRVVRMERLKRDSELQSLRSEIATLQQGYNRAVTSSAVAETETTRPDLVETSQRLVDAEKTLIAAVLADRDEFQALADTYAKENDELRIRAGTAERERDYLRTECTRLRQVTPAEETTDDQASALIAREINEELRERGEVDGAQNRLFAILPQFVLTIDAHGARFRPKILRACADVVIGAPSLLARRDDHVLRTGEGANDPARIRQYDGAEARRCYVEQNTPSARRLHYWSLPDGSVQFASVNVHDDVNIPE